MRTKTLQALGAGWGNFGNLHLALRLLIIVIAWPILLGLYVFSRSKNAIINFTAFFLLIVFFQIPWIASIVEQANLTPMSTSTSGEKSKSKDLPKVEKEEKEEFTSPSPTVSPVIDLSYGAITTDCTNYFMTGTLEVKNSGNTSISGRAEIPVSTYEKFKIPLSWIFLDLPPGSSTTILLEGGEGCKKGQVIGKPSTVFTIPSQGNLETLNQLDAFEWSSVKAVCDKGSGRVRLKASARNTSEFTLTAGIQGYLANGPLSQGQIDAGNKGSSFFGTIYKLEPGETREIDFGYGDGCIKGKKGFDGPYLTQFETRFTY